MRPYDPRHAFCSLLIGESMSVVEVARQAGHAPTMTLATYAHPIADLDGGERMSAEAAIRAAREGGGVRKVCASAVSEGQWSRKPPCLRDGRWWTRTTDLFLISQERVRAACIRQHPSAHANACKRQPTPARSRRLADAGVGRSRDAGVRAVCAVWWRIHAAGVGSRR
jgi:hypothetical protein